MTKLVCDYIHFVLLAASGNIKSILLQGIHQEQRHFRFGSSCLGSYFPESRKKIPLWLNGQTLVKNL